MDWSTLIKYLSLCLSIILFSSIAIIPSANATNCFDPLTLTGIHSWYDANDISTITKDGADRISQWNDKTGNGHDLLQATGGNQPLWLSEDRDGLDVIDFVGDRWMDNSFTTLTQPVTIYMAAVSPTGIVGVADGTFYDAQTNAGGAFYKSDMANRYVFYAGTAFIEFTEAGHSGEWDYYTTIWNNTASKMRFGGVEKVSGTASVLALDGFTVASKGTAGQYGNNKVGEIIIQNGLGTAQDIANVEEYFNNKWMLNLYCRPITLT